MTAFTVSQDAKDRIIAKIQDAGRGERALRVRITGWSAEEFEYRLEVLPLEMLDQADLLIEDEDLPIALAADSIERLQGAELNYEDAPMGAGFNVENPNPVWTDPLEKKVQTVLDTVINPGIASHGGRVMLHRVQDGTAFVQFSGGCQGCGLSNVTLKQGVNRAIQEQMPEIANVVDVTDHAAGENPFYKPSEVEGAQSPVAP